MITMGWECPRCHRCYAPSVTQCPHCGGTSWTPNPYPYTPTPYQPYRVIWGSGSVTTSTDPYITINFTSDTKENNA